MFKARGFINFLFKTGSVFLLFFSSPLYGGVFKAPYVRFNIELKWNCRAFGANWVCHHYFEKGAFPGFILLTAREGQSLDDINLYIQSLSRGQNVFSEKVYSKKIIIHRQAWVEGFYRNSFFPGAFSRYVATVCCDNRNDKIHVLIGFHAHQVNYTKYSSEFLRSIKSLRLSQNLKKTLDLVRGQTKRQNQEMMSYIERILSESDEEITPELQKSPALLISLLFITLFAGAGFLFYFFRKKKKRRSRRKKL